MSYTDCKAFVCIFNCWPEIVLSEPFGDDPVAATERLFNYEFIIPIPISFYLLLLASFQAMIVSTA